MEIIAFGINKKSISLRSGKLSYGVEDSIRCYYGYQLHEEETFEEFTRRRKLFMEFLVKNLTDFEHKFSMQELLTDKLSVHAKGVYTYDIEIASYRELSLYLTINLVRMWFPWRQIVF